MRRSGAYGLVALGLVALFLAPLAKFYVVPRVKKIPTDYYFRAVSVGTGSYLDPSHGFTVVGPVKIENIHLVKGDPAASSKTVAVWDSFDSTFDVNNRHELSYALADDPPPMRVDAKQCMNARPDPLTLTPATPFGATSTREKNF